LLDRINTLVLVVGLSSDEWIRRESAIDAAAVGSYRELLDSPEVFWANRSTEEGMSKGTAIGLLVVYAICGLVGVGAFLYWLL
jgi:hypothetical protein